MNRHCSMRDIAASDGMIRSFVTLILVVSSLLRPTDASDLPFEHVIIDAQPPEHPWIKIEGDIDGAGRPDILGANHGGPFQPVGLWLN